MEISFFTDAVGTIVCSQKFRSVDLAQDGDKRVLNANGEETEAFVDPLRVQYRDILEVCLTSATREYLKITLLFGAGH